jgi:hypothetical protein
MAFIGLDLTDPHAKSPRAVDVAVVDDSGSCAFEKLAGIPGADLAAWLAPVTKGPESGDVLIVDGPLALASTGASLRHCERLLGTPGKTPDVAPRPGTRPFAGYVAGSVALASRLVAAGWEPLEAPTENGTATLLEAYPGAAWPKLVNGKLPHKTTREGLRAREAVLTGHGLRFSRPPATHDEADAALCAWLGWQLRRHGAGAVRLVGTPCFHSAGRLREGVILDVQPAEQRIGVRRGDEPRRGSAPAAAARRDGEASDGAVVVLPPGVSADWIYFANPTKADRLETAELALTEEVLWRKVHNSAGGLCSNVGRVRVGDVILLAYSSGAGQAQAIGTFRVMEPTAPVGRAPALEQITDAKLSERLARSGYAVDPVLGVQTGFLVETLWAGTGEDVAVTRPAGNNAIWRAARGDPSA